MDNNIFGRLGSIPLDNLSDRELLLLSVRGLNELCQKVDRQNSRINKLEDWRNMMIGGMGLLTVIIPTLVYLVLRGGRI